MKIKTIDLRSDTLTQPTPAMKEAMFAAQLGDDVFGEDPTVSQLETKLADKFGMEAGLFCPSGTMTNQIAIRLHTGPQKELICHQDSHIYLYEAGGIMSNSMASVKLLGGDAGKLTSDSIRNAINPENDHFPETTLVALENTMNKGGGSVYHLEEVEPIYKFCKEAGLKLHLDGARIFNALTVTKDDPRDWGAMMDTVSVCLSKGLGCPVGSVLLGTRTDIRRARKIRKSLGGGMRQAGFLAAAGIYALDNHITRLQEDHQRAYRLGEILSAQSWVKEVLPVATNIVIARLNNQSPRAVLEKLGALGIKAGEFGQDRIRMVTHLDFSEEDLEEVEKRLSGRNQD